MTGLQRGNSAGRLLVPVLLALVLVGAGALPVLGAETNQRGPKVVIIVGPTGSLTAGFRAEADASARAARRYTDDVTTIYSPHAMWEAVKPALQGASLVVYMGHGNGWPSIYRDSPYPRTQNGLGLNPAAGGGDHTHRYYGEHYLAREVQLAPGAIVLLHHLCYAAGNSEPGLPEGPHDVARQRVENFAAGWLAAGAGAVVAEAYLAPRYYIQSVLGSNRDIETIWRSSPTYKNNVDAWASSRTDGATAFIDPTRGGRYGRSLVVLGSDVRLPAGSRSPIGQSGAEDELPSPLAGITFGAASTEGRVVTWSTVELRLPYELADGATLPEDIMIGAQWQPVELDSGPLTLADLVAQQQGFEPETEADEAVVSELDGLREPLPAEVRRGSLRVPLLTPELPGLYELSLSLYDGDGELLEPDGGPFESPLVHVARRLSASFVTSPEIKVSAGQAVELTLALTNNGIVAWEQDEADLFEEYGPDPFRALPALPARLVARAVRLTDAAEEPVLPDAPLFAVEARLAPDETIEFVLSFGGPGIAGEYLLVLDVETPSYGSLAATGVSPAIILLDVGPAPLPAPLPLAH